MRPHSRAVTLVVATLLSVGALATPATAASPVLGSASPAAGSATKTRPSGVTLGFNQAVATSSTISVAGPTGASTCTKSSPTSSPSATLACNFGGFPAPTLPDGTYTVTYRADSTTGDAPTSGSYAFTIDTVAPTAPTGLTFTPSDYVAVSDTLVVSGTSEKAGDTVTVTLASGASVESTTTAGAGGAFSASFTAAQVRTLDDGTLTASVRSTDTAGNTSPAATATTDKDTSRPTVVSTTPAAGGGRNSAGFTYDLTASEALGATTTVKLLDASGAEVPATTTINGSSATTTPTAAIAPGSYRARIQLVDLQGNQGDLVERTFTVDDGAPLAPVITTPVATINRGNVTAVPVSGTGEAGATVTLTAGTVTATAVVAAGGGWSLTFNASTLADGAVTLSAVQRDTAGNTSPSVSASTTKDTVAPRVTGQAAAPSTVTSSATTATVSGTVNNGTTTAGEETSVRVSVDDTDAATAPRVATGTSSASGAFTIPVDVAALSDGTLTYTIVATDAAGNASTAVTTTNTKNTAQPAAPTVVITPSPINNANKASIVISGTATGASVDVSLSDGTTVVQGSSTISQGRYSVTLSSTTLADGQVTARAVAIDAVGNRSPVGVATTTKDTVAPTAPTGLTAPTFISTPTIEVKGNAEPGSTVTVTATDAGGPLTQRTATGTAVVPASGAWTVTLTVSTFAEGTVTITARATDVAGNPGATASITRPKDTTGPGQPATLTATPAVYSASSTTFRVSGTVASADASATGLTADITVSDSDANTPNLTATGLAVTSGAFAADFTAAQMAGLAEGALTVSAVVRDPAGNAGTARTASAVKNTLVLDLLSTTPAAGTTVKTAPTVSATYNENLATASTLVVTNRAGATVAGSKAVSGKTITFTPNAALTEANGPYTVTLRGIDATDSADTEDDTFTFSVDATVPAAPAITSVTNPVNAERQKNVTASGTSAEPGLTITVTIGSVTAKGTSSAGGAWSISGIDVTALADGTLSVTATAADAAGNTSPASAAATTVKDATGPVITNLAATGASTTSPRTTVTGTRSETSTVALTATDGTQTVSGTVAAGTGAFTATLDLTAFTPGTVTVTARATDTVGNPGPVATTTLVFANPPASSTTTLTLSSSLVAYQAPLTLSGTVTRPRGGTAAPVQLTATTANGTVVDLGTVPVAADGSFTKTIRPSVNATYVAAYPGDEGNTASQSSERSAKVSARVRATSPTGRATVAAVVSGTATTANSTLVILVRRNANGSVTKLATTRVSNKAFRFKVRLAKGSTRLEVRVAASRDNAAGLSTLVARRT